MLVMLFIRDHEFVTPNDLHSVVDICAIFFLVLAVVSVIGRLYTKVAVVHRLKLDDYLILVALALYGTQTAAVIVATENGLGRHWDTLDDSKRIIYAKSTYTAGLLYIFTVITIKISIITFMRALVPCPSHAKFSLALGITFIAWGIGSVFAAAFQCKLPSPWLLEGNACFDILSLWNSFSILNILTDVVLVLWPAFIVSKLHTALQKRMIVIACFACRFLVVGTVVAELVLVNRAAYSIDRSFHAWRWMICTQLIQAASISAACIPYLKPFLKSFESGLLASDDLRRRGMKGVYGYGMHDTASRKNSTPLPMTVKGTSIRLKPMDYTGHKTLAQGSTPQIDADESISGQAIIIRYTTSWRVDRQPRETGAHGV